MPIRVSSSSMKYVFIPIFLSNNVAYIWCSILLGSPRLDDLRPVLPSIVVVELNSTLNLTVYLVAYPPPTINWTLLSPINTTVNSTEAVNGIFHSSRLYISNVKSSDIGLYTIHATNSIGDLYINVTIEKSKYDKRQL